MKKFSIETKRLIIRPFKISDATDYFYLTRDRKIQKYVPCLGPDTLGEACKEFERICKNDSELDLYLMLESKEKRKIIGAIIARNDRKNNWDMNLLISKKCRRQGFMTEALNALTVAMPKGTKLFFLIDKTNKASYNMVRKLKNVNDISAEYKYLNLYAFEIQC